MTAINVPAGSRGAGAADLETKRNLAYGGRAARVLRETMPMQGLAGYLLVEKPSHKKLLLSLSEEHVWSSGSFRKNSAFESF